MEQELNSELFSSSYSIFIDCNDVTFFKNILKQTNLDKVGIKILKSNFDPELSVIVIPSGMEFLNIEKYLFRLNGRTGTFWGQLGLGYSGKTWTLV